MPTTRRADSGVKQARFLLVLRDRCGFQRLFKPTLLQPPIVVVDTYTYNMNNKPTSKHARKHAPVPSRERKPPPLPARRRLQATALMTLTSLLKVCGAQEQWRRRISSSTFTFDHSDHPAESWLSFQSIYNSASPTYRTLTVSNSAQAFRDICTRELFCSGKCSFCVVDSFS